MELLKIALFILCGNISIAQKIFFPAESPKGLGAAYYLLNANLI
jgi:hypothetical protein